MFGKIWSGVKKVGSFVLRRGPIIAAALVGLQSVPAIAQYAQYALGLLGIFGVQPASPEVSQTSTELVTQVALLIGAIRKIWALLKPFIGLLK